jgi:hypothetical protein
VCPQWPVNGKNEEKTKNYAEKRPINPEIHHLYPNRNTVCQKFIHENEPVRY